jgi:hypothetical protein
LRKALLAFEKVLPVLPKDLPFERKAVLVSSKGLPVFWKAGRLRSQDAMPLLDRRRR